MTRFDSSLAGVRQVVEAELGRFSELFLDDLVAEIDALVADVDTGASDQLLDLLLALSTERTLEQVATVTYTRHPRYSLLVRPYPMDFRPTAGPHGAAPVQTLPRTGLEVAPLAACPLCPAAEGLGG
jgi:hypothetical protein